MLIFRQSLTALWSGCCKTILTLALLVLSFSVLDRRPVSKSVNDMNKSITLREGTQILFWYWLSWPSMCQLELCRSPPKRRDTGKVDFSSENRCLSMDKGRSANLVSQNCNNGSAWPVSGIWLIPVGLNLRHEASHVGHVWWLQIVDSDNRVALIAPSTNLKGR